MRRNRGSPSPTNPYRALAHHHAHYGSTGGSNHATQQQNFPYSASSLIRSFNVETNPTRPVRPSPLTASIIPDMPLDLVDRIRSFPLFSSAPDNFLVAIGGHLRLQIHMPHDHILTEGDDAKAMYWLVRGVVAVTSRDGEAVYAELKPGAFFGEIGILMNMPRTATIIARTKCMLLVLKKEDLQAELPNYPEMEKAIRHEAQERLTILKKKRQERGYTGELPSNDGSSIAREAAPGEVSTGEVGVIREGVVVKSKKRKSPSPSAIEDPSVGGSALGSAYVNVRNTLKELPLFSALPPDILHFLGLSAQPKSYTPFTDIIRQGSTGNDIFFMVRGEAEVIHEPPGSDGAKRPNGTSIRPRLRQGQYFGEVASLGLSDWRTATVRAITAVECLVVGGTALEELWRRCPPEIRHQVEETARTRYQKPDEDIEMADIKKSTTSTRPALEGSMPQVTFTAPSIPTSPTHSEFEARQPSDPDPYLSVDMENLRNRRRNSLAPPTNLSDVSSNGVKCHVVLESSSPNKTISPATNRLEEVPGPSKRARIFSRRTRSLELRQKKVLIPDDVLARVFSFLSVLEMIRLRVVCLRWRRILKESPKLCTVVNLGQLNQRVTDWSLANILAPFIGQRPVEIDISNCFHVTDEGFQALWRSCGRNVKVWRMRSVWDVSASQILDMSETAKGLEEVDWSNCRKVGDNLLARVVGWVVPEPLATSIKSVAISSSNGRKQQRGMHPNSPQQQPAVQHALPPPGTIIGCPSLRRLDLSYCKHITDRSMAHLAAHASHRLERLSLTRCTSITDNGFQTWAPYRFTQLTHLRLADCTYLSDNSIIALVNAAKNLTHLDLSFCCALSDTATEVVALGLPRLQELRLAFCGSAVSDASLGCIALHLNELLGLSVRGCVRVTGIGVENVLEGCGRLEWLDVSQCKNLGGWLGGGGVSRWGFDERPILWDVVDGLRKSPTSTRQQHEIAKNGASQHGAAGFRTGLKRNEGAKGAIPRQGLLPVVSPRGTSTRRARKLVRFVVEKGPTGLR